MKRLVTLSSLFLLLLLSSTVRNSQLGAASDGTLAAPVAQSANHAPSAAELSNTLQSPSLMSFDDSSKATNNAQDGQNVEVVGQIGGSFNSVFVQGNYAYVGEGPVLTILDISNPASLTVVGKTAPMPDVVQDIYVSSNLA